MLTQLPGSIPVGSLFGIPIRLHILFFFTLVIQLLGSIYYGPWHVLLWFLLLGPILLCTVLFHELGHCLAARSVGGVVHGILLWPLGGLAFIGHNAGPKRDLWVAFAGPLTHIPAVGFWIAMLFPATYNATGSFKISLVLPSPEGAAQLGLALCVGAIVMNISLFAFNLLVPAYPLDGGRMLVDFLLLTGVEEYTAAKITIGIAVPIGVATIIVGGVIYYVFVFQMVTILVGCFILYSTLKLYTYVRDGTLLTHPMFCYTEHEGGSQEPFALPVSVNPSTQPQQGKPAAQGVELNSEKQRLNTAPPSASV